MFDIEINVEEDRHHRSFRHVVRIRPTRGMGVVHEVDMLTMERSDARPPDMAEVRRAIMDRLHDVLPEVIVECLEEGYRHAREGHGRRGLGGLYPPTDYSHVTTAERARAVAQVHIQTAPPMQLSMADLQAMGVRDDPLRGSVSSQPRPVAAPPAPKQDRPRGRLLILDEEAQA